MSKYRMGQGLPKGEAQADALRFAEGKLSNMSGLATQEERRWKEAFTEAQQGRFGPLGLMLLDEGAQIARGVIPIKENDDIETLNTGWERINLAFFLLKEYPGLSREVHSTLAGGF